MTELNNLFAKVDDRRRVSGWSGVEQWNGRDDIK